MTVLGEKKKFSQLEFIFTMLNVGIFVFFLKLFWHLKKIIHNILEIEYQQRYKSLYLLLSVFLQLKPMDFLWIDNRSDQFILDYYIDWVVANLAYALAFFSFLS